MWSKDRKCRIAKTSTSKRNDSVRRPQLVLQHQVVNLKGIIPSDTVFYSYPYSEILKYWKLCTFAVICQAMTVAAANWHRVLLQFMHDDPKPDYDNACNTILCIQAPLSHKLRLPNVCYLYIHRHIRDMRQLRVNSKLNCLIAIACNI